MDVEFGRRVMIEQFELALNRAAKDLGYRVRRVDTTEKHFDVKTGSTTRQYDGYTKFKIRGAFLPVFQISWGDKSSSYQKINLRTGFPWGFGLESEAKELMARAYQHLENPL